MDYLFDANDIFKAASLLFLRFITEKINPEEPDPKIENKENSCFL